jgi:hypothetical protein
MRSFEMVRLPIQQIGHPLDHNVVAHVRSSRELVEAEDMIELSRFIDSRRIDYLQPEMRFEQKSPQCVES